MNCLVLYAHPRENSLNATIKNEVVKKLKVKNHNVEISNLYEMEFDPILKNDKPRSTNEQIKAEQNKLKNADFLIVISPVWWFGFPAILKGWFDTVLAPGFAYKYDAGGVVPLLHDKNVIIFNTFGTPEHILQNTGVVKAFERVIDKGIFGFCGMNVVAHKYFGAVLSVGEHAIESMLDEVIGTIEIFC